MKQRKEQLSFFDEIIVDNFAGGGGASTGIELAAGRYRAAVKIFGASYDYTRGYLQFREQMKARKEDDAWML